MLHRHHIAILVACATLVACCTASLRASLLRTDPNLASLVGDLARNADLTADGVAAWDAYLEAHGQDHSMEDLDQLAKAVVEQAIADVAREEHGWRQRQKLAEPHDRAAGRRYARWAGKARSRWGKLKGKAKGLWGKMKGRVGKFKGKWKGKAKGFISKWKGKSKGRVNKGKRYGRGMIKKGRAWRQKVTSDDDDDTEDDEEAGSGDEEQP